MDSSDRARVTEAKLELRRILNDPEMKDALLLVFANKQDIPGAMSVQEVIENLDLKQFKRRTYFTQRSCATTGDGIFEGLVS